MQTPLDLNFSGFLALGILFFLVTLVLLFISGSYKSALKKADFFETLFKDSGLASFVINTEDLIVTANSAMSECSGYSLERLRQKVWYDFLVPDEEAVKIRHQIQKNSQGEFEFLLVDSHGRIQNFRCFYHDFKTADTRYRLVTLIPSWKEKNAFYL